MFRTRRRLVGPIALVAGLVVAFPLGVLAAISFSDVPPSHPFYYDIQAVAEAGVTTGCGGGKYCPDDNVTRGQMAAFMNRLGALGAGKTPVANADKLDGLDSTQLARTDGVQHYSCAGIDMHPDAYDVRHVSGDGARWLYDPGNLTCAVHLPDGATVTNFAADVYDNWEAARRPAASSASTPPARQASWPRPQAVASRPCPDGRLSLTTRSTTR